MHAASPARQRFASGLVAEVSLAAPAWRDPRPFDTVYFGGGTPSQLAPEELARVLDACRTQLKFTAPGAETDRLLVRSSGRSLSSLPQRDRCAIAGPPDPVTDSISADRFAAALNRRGDCGAETDRLLVPPDPWVFLEANPEDVTPEACAAWRALGVRTLSLGVQSFSDEALRFLGRRHSGREARAAIETALASGFDTVSIDLIFGLRGQTAEDWRLELTTAVSLEPQHLSCYQLTIHPRTRFGIQAKHGQLSELSEDDQAALFELTHRFLADAGWPAYEVSNFARGPAHQSRHNRKYWDHTPYLGLGPSAHSLAASEAPARRWWNERGTPHWERRVAAGERPIEAQELLDPKDLAEEALLLGLRTTAGIDLDGFRARYGVDLLAANDTLVARLVDEGRIVVRTAAEDGRWLVPTLSGLAVADGLAAAFDLSPPN